MPERNFHKGEHTPEIEAVLNRFSQELLSAARAIQHYRSLNALPLEVDHELDLLRATADELMGHFPGKTRASILGPKLRKVSLANRELEVQLERLKNILI